MKKEIEEIVEKISPAIKSLNSAVEESLPLLESEVDRIIQMKITEKNEIERMLDQLLDIAFHPEALKIFKKLCRYYYYINPVVTAEYIYGYRDMWDDKAMEVIERRSF